MSNENENNENEVEIQHQVILEEDGIRVSDLPVEIQRAISNFNKKLKEYQKTGDSDLFYELTQDDIAIADDITTWLEDNEADDEDEDESYNEEEEEKENKQQQQQQQQQQPQVSDLEKKVRDSLKNGVIGVEELESIIKREPDYPNEQIGNLKLRKQYLKPFYEVA